MFNRTSTTFIPDDDGIKLLDLLSEGFTETEIADQLGLSAACIRQRTKTLRDNLGVDTNEQMLYEYGRWKERKK